MTISKVFEIVDAMKPTVVGTMEHTDTSPHGQAQPLAMWLKAYLGLALIHILVTVVMLIFFAPSLKPWQILCGIGLAVFGVVFTWLLTAKRLSLVPLELLRFVLMIWFSVVLWQTPESKQMAHSIEVKGTSHGVLQYASSPKYWPQWHPQSKKVYLQDYRPLLVGEQFEEDIGTPIGNNHLLWTVVNSIPGESWEVHAQNQTNGSSIQIKYKVQQQGDTTLFNRSLSYQLPHFGLAVINALYMTKKVEAKSIDSLQRFKVAYEQR